MVVVLGLCVLAWVCLMYFGFALGFCFFVVFFLSLVFVVVVVSFFLSLFLGLMTVTERQQSPLFIRH